MPLFNRFARRRTFPRIRSSRSTTRLHLELLEERINPVTFSGGNTYDELAAYPNSVAAGNIFGNGYNDIAMGAAQDGVIIFKNDGHGNFTATGNDGYFSDIRSIWLSDLTNNGKEDLVVSQGDQGNVGIAMGNGDGTFQSAIGISGFSGGVQQIAVADLNNDGLPDLIGLSVRD